MNVDQIFSQFSLDGLFAFDRELRCTVWSTAMERLFGIPKKDVIGKVVSDIFSPLEISKSRGILHEVLSGKDQVLQSRTFRIPGSEVYGFVDAYFFPFRDDDRQVVGGVAIVRDVTERKKSEERLKETENRFKVMADCAPVMLWMSRTDALCDFFNQTWLNFTGRNMEQEFGVGWAEGIHPEDFQKCMDTYLAAFNAREPFSMEYRLRRQDGQYRWILDNGVPRSIPGGLFAGYIGSCIDITDRRETEEQKNQLLAQLKEALESRDRFISVASHELKTPLTSLKLQSQLFERYATRFDTPSESIGKLNKMNETSHRQIERIAKLVDDMLDVTRITNHKLNLQIGTVNLRNLLDGVLERFSSQLKDAGCSVTIIQEAAAAEGNWDEFRIEQILINLISNAMKFGSGKPIEVFITSDQRKVTLTIRDHGIGIIEKDQSRIFQCFERAISENEISGLGLGLYISKQIALAHGGEIRVKSEPGTGADFSLELPIRVPSHSLSARI